MKKTKDNTALYAIIGSVAVVAIIIVIAVMVNRTPKFTFTEPYLGPKDAKVVVDIYSDFECPACQQLNQTVTPKLISKYSKSDVKFVYHQYPLPQHSKGKTAAYTSACAAEQNKFWPYHDLLVAKYDDWTNNTNLLETYAEDLKLDMSRFDKCRKSSSVKDFINTLLPKSEKDYTPDGKAAVIPGTTRTISATPTVYIGTEKIVGVQPIAKYESVINNQLKAK